LHGRKRSRSDHKWTSEAGLPFYFRGKSAEELLQEVVRPWVELLREGFESGFMYLLRYDELYFRDYLWEHVRSEDIDYVEHFSHTLQSTNVLVHSDPTVYGFIDAEYALSTGLIPFEFPPHKTLVMFDSNEKGLANF
jgi:hypothetical protein